MTTLLVDANNIAMRAVHAMSRSGLTSDRGVATGPLVAFIGTLAHHIREEQPDKVAVCWDGGRSEHRLALDSNYKAHRLSMAPDQEEAKESTFALCKEFCTGAGLYHIERPGIEADDLIAQYVHDRPWGETVVILSSDKDFLMLLDDEVHANGRTLVAAPVEQVRLSSAGTPTDRWTAQRVREEMGCLPGDLSFAMALAGDVSDNVPGVPRFGMKTAIKALKKHDWSFENVLRDDLRVVEHVERARLNLSLVDLRAGLDGLVLPDLPLFRPTSPGDVLYPLMLSFLTKYQIKSVQTRLYDGTLWK
jgi:DNA polymerase I